MEVRTVWHQRMADYYREIDRRLQNEPTTGLLTLEDNLRRERIERASADMHRIAALVETVIGKGLLSRDIRNLADRIGDINKIKA